MRIATLLDVARAAGVTHQTVSRILGGKAHLHAPATVDRVRGAADQLGYRPHLSAQSLRRGASTAIAFLADPSLARSSLPSALIAGILDGLTSRGWHLVVDRQGDVALAGAGFVPRLLERVWARGALVNIHGATDLPIAERLAADRIPAIWLNRSDTTDALGFDDEAAVLTLVAALRERGAKRMCYLAESHGTAHPHISQIVRADAFAAATRAAPRWLGPGGEPTHALVQQVLATVQATRPDAIITYGMREIALLTGHVLPALGLRPGHDVLLGTIGTWAEVRHQPVLAMIQPWEEMGRIAVDMLAQRLEVGESVPSRLLPCRFDAAPGEHDP